MDPEANAAYCEQNHGDHQAAAVAHAVPAASSSHLTPRDGQSGAATAGGAAEAQLVDRIAGVLIVRLPRDDAGSRETARLWSDAEQAAAGQRRVVFDLSQVRELNQRSLSAMVRCLRRCQRRGTATALCSLSREALTVLELNGVPHLTAISETPLSAAQILADREECS